MMFVPLQPTEESNEVLDKMEESVRDELVRKCVQAIIVLGQDRNPIKRQELNRLAFPNNNYYRTTQAVVQAANKQLNKTFGMRLYELDDKTRYLLVNSNTDFADCAKLSDDMCKELTVLYFILMDIFASPDERITQDDIYNSLSPLDLTSDQLKSYIDLFVKKLYLTLDKRGEVRMYSWGPRAYAEVEPENFFNRFLDLMPDTTEQDWPDLKKRADKLKSMPFR